ncbi:DUF3293 domain-containing protein [Acetobacter sp. AN02]|uniref:DUF3293 domain-containing protein n=1 Tax=Acetobacter sp. AN02 TaxID=2894186 RepID=UPI0024341B9D|nr:DUF3293 domain-containing protein [Acetobacter sp. AN02]MDG6094321.1 DUF3293 domain-containing protein [Acetobacter sp. AN02]
MGGLRPTPSILRAYCLSTYTAGSITVRIGRPPRGMCSRHADIVMLSACNPGGRRKADGWNERMMWQLRRDLAGAESCEGEGRLGRVAEPLIAVRMPLARALRLAARYRQNAVVLLRGTQKARLLFLPGCEPISGSG